jgi:hypothetical protein
LHIKEKETSKAGDNADQQSNILHTSEEFQRRRNMIDNTYVASIDMIKKSNIVP